MRGGRGRWFVGLFPVVAVEADGGRRRQRTSSSLVRIADVGAQLALAESTIAVHKRKRLGASVVTRWPNLPVTLRYHGLPLHVTTRKKSQLLTSRNHDLHKSHICLHFASASERRLAMDSESRARSGVPGYTNSLSGCLDACTTNHIRFTPG